MKVIFNLGIVQKEKKKKEGVVFTCPLFSPLPKKKGGGDFVGVNREKRGKARPAAAMMGWGGGEKKGEEGRGHFW